MYSRNRFGSSLIGKCPRSTRGSRGRRWGGGRSGPSRCRTSPWSAPALPTEEVDEPTDRRVVRVERFGVARRDREVAAAGGAEEVLPERRRLEEARPGVAVAGHADVARSVARAGLDRADGAGFDRQPHALGAEIETQADTPEARGDAEFPVGVCLPHHPWPGDSARFHARAVA